MSNIFKPRDCPICGNKYNKNSITKLFKYNNNEEYTDYSISECLKCRFIHQNPSWDQNFYDDLYKFFYYPVEKNIPDRNNKRFQILCDNVSELEFKKNRNIKILDYGCNNGSFINWAKKNATWSKNTSIIGYDIQLRGVEKEDRFYNSYDRLRKDHSQFDVIILNFVLEHILDPVGLLVLLSKTILKENGYIMVEVPDTSFINDYDYSPFHIQHTNYFTPLSISRAFSQANLATHIIKSYNNYDIRKYPNTPSIIAIASKDDNYIKNGKRLQLMVNRNRNRMKSKINNLGQKLKIGIVGCGDALHPLIKFSDVDKRKIIALFDNNKKLWGSTMYGKTIYPVKDIYKFGLDLIIISTLFIPSIIALRNQLLNYVDRDNVISFHGEIL